MCTRSFNFNLKNAKAPSSRRGDTPLPDPPPARALRALACVFPTILKNLAPPTKKILRTALRGTTAPFLPPPSFLSFFIPPDLTFLFPFSSSVSPFNLFSPLCPLPLYCFFLNFPLLNPIILTLFYHVFYFLFLFSYLSPSFVLFYLVFY